MNVDFDDKIQFVVWSFHAIEDQSSKSFKIGQTWKLSLKDQYTCQ